MNDSQVDPPAARAVSVPGRSVAVGLVLFIGTWFLFSRALQCEFLDLDDPDYVTANLHVQSGLRPANAAWAFTTSAAGNWHPLTWLSHMLDSQWFGNDPRGPHATNIFWHALNGVLAFLVLKRLLSLRPIETSGNQSQTLWSCAIGAALFAWHPLRVESVAWVAERKDVLSAFFFLLALMAYLKYANPKPEIRNRVRSRRREEAEIASSGTIRLLTSAATYGFRISDFGLPLRSPFYWLTLLFFALGLMCKPMLVTLPFLFLLLDWWPLARVSRLRGASARQAGVPPALRFGEAARCHVSGSAGARLGWTRLLLEKVPFFMVTAGSCVVTYLFQKKSGAVIESLPMGDRLANAVVSVAAYLEKMFWPFNLAIGYPRVQWPAIILAGAAFLLLAITGFAFAQRRRRPWLAVGWFWFLGTLVPVLGLVPVGLQAMADRYTYLPMLGIVLAVTGTVCEGKLNLCWLAPAAGVLLLAGCAARTWNQLAYWRNSHALYEHALAVTKGNYLAHCYLGTTLFNESRWEEARDHFQRAMETRPGYATARLRLGLTLEKQGRERDALTAFDAYLQINPGDADAQFRCGNLLARMDRDEDALAHYKKAIHLRPDFATAECNYADSLRAVKRFDDACAHYRRALALQPHSAYAFYGLAMALEDSGHERDALTDYRRAIELKPDFADAQYNLGLLLLNHDAPAEALDHFQAAIGIRTNFAAAFVGLGLAEAQLDRTQAAVRDLEQAQRLNPNVDGLSQTLTQLREKLAAGGL